MAMNSRADQFDTLRQYWHDFLLTNAIAPSLLTNVVIPPAFSGGGHFYVNYTVTNISSTASNYWNTMNTSPSRTYLWSDLPFGSSSPSITGTFDRLHMMALAWAMPGSSLQGNAALGSAVTNALDWMNTHIYTPTAGRYGNWFNWVISGPESLVHTMTLIYPMLTGTQITNYCLAIDNFSPGGAHATPAPGWMTGANTSELVLLMSLRGIVGKDGTRITTATNHIGPVFPFVTSGEGFYADGSYVFHSNLAYNGNYGMGCLADMAVLGPLLNGSAWQITDPNLTNVFSWVFNAYEPFIYNGALMDMVRGRTTSFPSATEYITGANVLSYLQQIGQFAPLTMGVAMSNFVNAPLLPPGQFHFANMDRVLALRSGFGFGIAMSSTRIANYESINGNNLHGWFTGDGMTYLYVGKTENQFNNNFWATVDPYHMPGTTEETNALANAANEDVTSGQNWVGGAQVSQTFGVAGMSFHAAATTLYGKKSWFMLDNEIVCLGAGITSGDASGVQTTAENRRLATPLTNSFTFNGAAITPTVGWSSNLPSATPSWCALGGTGGYYFPAGNSNLQAAFTTNSGSWLQINTEAGSVTDPSVFTDNYFKLWFDHGLKPTNATYAYILLPGMNAGSVSNYALNPDMIIITNTPGIQAVKKKGLGVVAANFWTNGTSTADIITVNSQASVITSETSSNISVGISDPTQTNKSSITVTLNRSALGVSSVDSGVSVVQLTPQIILSVNVNGAHGKTFQATLQLPMFALNPNQTNNNTVLSFPTRFGYNYQLLYKNSLTDAIWSPLGGVMTGDNTAKSMNDLATNSNRFYKVQAQ
jgi:hyaluronate lyase